MDTFDWVMRQVKKPSGFLGRIVARGMNRTHRARTNWGLKHVEIKVAFSILDVGCGGGGTIKKLANIASEGRVYGIDFSSDSVKVARKTNKRLIGAELLREAGFFGVRVVENYDKGWICGIGRKR